MEDHASMVVCTGFEISKWYFADSKADINEWMDSIVCIAVCCETRAHDLRSLRKCGRTVLYMGTSGCVGRILLRNATGAPGYSAKLLHASVACVAVWS